MDAFLYDQFAEIDRSHWWFVARRRIVTTLLRAELQKRKPQNILDIGCGTGGMLSLLTEFSDDVWGMDMSQEAIDYCKKQEFSKNIHLYHGILPENMPDCAESWDMITAFDVVEHIDDDQKIINDVYGKLAEKGIFVCTVPAMMYLWGPHDDLNHHKRRYSSKEIREKIEKAGFKIKKLTYYNSILFPVVAAVRVSKRLLSFGKETVPKSDFTMPSAFVNDVLIRIFQSEESLLTKSSFPLGVSLFVIAEKS